MLRRSGLGELGCPPKRSITLGELRARGLGEGFQIHASASDALRAGYGQLYTEGGQVKVTTPYAGITVKDVTKVYPDAQSALSQPGAYGYIYRTSTGFAVSGPGGAIALNAVYTPAVATLPVAPPSSPTPAPTSPATPAAPAILPTLVSAAPTLANAVGQQFGIQIPTATPAPAAAPGDGLSLLSQPISVPFVGDVPTWAVIAATIGLGVLAARAL